MKILIKQLPKDISKSEQEKMMLLVGSTMIKSVPVNIADINVVNMAKCKKNDFKQFTPKR